MHYTVTYPLTLIIEAPNETEASIEAERQLEYLATSAHWLDWLSIDADIEEIEAPPEGVPVLPPVRQLNLTELTVLRGMLP